MISLEKLQATLGPNWIPTIYSERIRKLRTRSISIDIAERENAPEILHTLLGVELKIGKLRISCPDLSTARYLRIFARIGCREIAIPYDITKISVITDELETAWQRMNLLLEGSSKRGRSLLISKIRGQLGSIGSGDAMPKFDRPTKQRPDK